MKSALLIIALLVAVTLPAQTRPPVLAGTFPESSATGITLQDENPLVTSLPDPPGLSPRTVDGTRFILGADAGQDFGNEFAGAVLGIERPIGRHFEADLYERPSPIESHLGLGTGFANVAQGGGIVWLKSAVALSGSMERSQYAVSSAEKAAYYAQMGPIFRLNLTGAPSRITVQYVRQISNGISSNGTESSHLNGFAFSLESRVSCASYACVRLKESFDVGHFLEQSNPVCDGTDANNLGEAPCPRKGGWSGGFTFTAVIEFGRRGRSSF